MKGIQKTAQSFYFKQRGVRLFIGLTLFSILALVTANFAGGKNFVSSAQEAITGEWLMDFTRKNPNEVQLTIVRQSPGGGNHMSSSGISINELQGLSREQAVGGRNDVRFRLVREAGTFEMEGTFRDGKGAGFWTLTPNPGFISEMRNRGYQMTEKDQFSAALHDVSVKGIEDLKSAGFDKLAFKELVEARIFNVTGDFAREMKSAGFEDITFKQLVEARIFKVDSQFAREVQALGFERQPFKSLVNMRIHKVTHEFVKEMRAAGFENLSIRELTDFRIHKVTPEFINEIKAEGFSQISSREAVNLRIHRVDGDFIRRVRAKGYSDVTLKQLVDLRIHNIIN